MSSKSSKRQRIIAFIFVNTIQYSATLNSSIYHSNKREPPPFFHSDTNTRSRSSPFCWQNQCSGFNSGTGLVVVLEHVFFFNFVPTPNKSLRFTRFRRSYENCTTVVLTNHCQNYTTFLINVQSDHVPFLQLFAPNDSAFA